MTTVLLNTKPKSVGGRRIKMVGSKDIVCDVPAFVDHWRPAGFLGVISTLVLGVGHLGPGGAEVARMRVDAAKPTTG